MTTIPLAVTTAHGQYHGGLVSEQSMDISKLIASLRQSIPGGAVRVEQGVYQVVSVSYDPAGKSTVSALSAWVADDKLESTIAGLIS